VPENILTCGDTFLRKNSDMGDTFLGKQSSFRVMVIMIYFINAVTTALAFRLLRSVYV